MKLLLQAGSDGCVPTPSDKRFLIGKRSWRLSLIGALFFNVLAAWSHAISLPATDEELKARVISVVGQYFSDFRHPRTYVPYGGLLKAKATWTKPEDIRARKPHPWGYGSHIEDTVLHAGHLLGALLAAHEAKPDPYLQESARQMYSALRFIYSKTPVPGLVPRGPHPDDETAVYDDSSMDQHTTFIISLALYANSALASAEDKAWVAKVLDEVGARLESNGWGIQRADGVTQSHVGFPWLGMVHEHASILMPALAGLWAGTKNPHWHEAYERFGSEQDSKRWKLLAPGEHVKINAHPIYANQNCFRIEAHYRFEADPAQDAFRSAAGPARREILKALLARVTRIQLTREYPNAFLTKLLPIDWKRLASECGWGGETLAGCEAAWKAFRPGFFDLPDSRLRDAAQLAHVRFPLGGVHMALLSQDPELIGHQGPMAWDMLEKVDLARIESGETRYLFAVVALLLYAERHTSR